MILDINMTLSDWLEYWFENYARRTVKRSTAISYRGYINNHISPKVGLCKLSELNTDILQTFFNSEYDSGNKKGGGLSAKTLHNMKLMLHKALSKAVDLELLRRNFTESVELPQMVSPEMRVLTLREQTQLMEEIRRSDDCYASGVWISLATGLRIGEVVGLQWGDIDFDEKRIYIRRTVSRLQKLEDSDKKTEIVIGTPKSRKSIRYIPFNSAVEARLLDYREKYSNTFSADVNSADFFISVRRGKPVETKSLQKYFGKLTDRAGISGATFHTLRHTFATRGIEKGIDPKTLSVLLGHADVATTLSRYAHVLDEQKRKAMDILLDDM